jgi:hypothetical protein
MDDGNLGDYSPVLGSISDHTLRSHRIETFPADSIGKGFRIKVEAHNSEGQSISEPVTFILAAVPTVSSECQSDPTVTNQMLIKVV